MRVRPLISITSLVYFLSCNTTSDNQSIERFLPSTLLNILAEVPNPTSKSNKRKSNQPTIDNGGVSNEEKEFTINWDNIPVRSSFVSYSERLAISKIEVKASQESAQAVLHLEELAKVRTPSQYHRFLREHGIHHFGDDPKTPANKRRYNIAHDQIYGSPKKTIQQKGGLCDELATLSAAAALNFTNTGRVEIVEVRQNGNSQ